MQTKNNKQILKHRVKPIEKKTIATVTTINNAYSQSLRQPGLGMHDAHIALDK